MKHIEIQGGSKMSKKMAKLLSMFLALLLILTSAAGCGKKNVPDENATGNTGANGAAAGEAAADKRQTMQRTMVTAFGTGQAPDVARIDIGNTASYAKQGGLGDLNSFDDFNASKESFLEGPLSTNLYKGSYYGLPLDTNCKKSKTEDRSQ